MGIVVTAPWCLAPAIAARAPRLDCHVGNHMVRRAGIGALLAILGLAGQPQAAAASGSRLVLYDHVRLGLAAAEIADPGRLVVGPHHAWPDELPAGVLSVVATPAGLYFHWSKGGRGLGRTVRIGADARLLVSEQSPGCDLPRPSLVALGSNLICHSADGSAEVARLDDHDGSYVREFRAPRGTLPGYSHLVTTGSYLLLYHAASGALAIGQISRDADEEHIEVIDAGVTDAGYVTLVSSHDRVLLHDPRSGRYEAARVGIVATGRPGRPDRRLEGRYQRTAQGVLGTGLRLAVTLDDVVLLHDRDGRYLVGRYTADDRFDVQDQGRATPGFDRIARAGAYLFLLAGDGSGQAAIGSISPAGRFREVGSMDAGRYDRVVAADG